MLHINNIKEASERIASFVNRTPVFQSTTFNNLIGAEVYFKCENFQKVGAFKYRGATNAILKLDKSKYPNGVVTHSSGNHAQALALAAKSSNIKAYIVMPETAPQVKVDAVRDYGAEIIFCAANPQARVDTANKIVEEKKATLIHPFDNWDIIHGQGTACYELLQDYPDIDTVIAPVSGGGLLSGTAIAAKGLNSNCKVFGAEPENVDDAYRSFKTGEFPLTNTGTSIADGLLAYLGEKNFYAIKNLLDDIFTVSENEIIASMKFLWERMKIVVEPSGAVAPAAIIKNKDLFKGKKIGIIISGGNVDLQNLPF